MLLRAVPDGMWDVAMVAFHLMSQNTREAVFPATLQHRVGTLLMFAVRSIFARADRVAEAMKELAAQGKVPQSLADDPDPLGFLIHPGGATSLTDAAYRYVRHEPGRRCGAVRHRRSGASAFEHRIDPAAAVAAGGPRPAEGAVQPSARRRPGVAAAREGSSGLSPLPVADHAIRVATRA